jgi:hypothetical protein
VLWVGKALRRVGGPNEEKRVANPLEKPSTPSSGLAGPRRMAARPSSYLQRIALHPFRTSNVISIPPEQGAQSPVGFLTDVAESALLRHDAGYPRCIERPDES